MVEENIFVPLNKEHDEIGNFNPPLRHKISTVSWQSEWCLSFSPFDHIFSIHFKISTETVIYILYYSKGLM